MTSKNDEENKALEAQEASEQVDGEADIAAPEKPKKTKANSKAINIDAELASRTTAATGYRAYYHQMMKDKK